MFESARKDGDFSVNKKSRSPFKYINNTFLELCVSQTSLQMVNGGQSQVQIPAPPPINPVIPGKQLLKLCGPVSSFVKWGLEQNLPQGDGVGG